MEVCKNCKVTLAYGDGYCKYCRTGIIWNKCVLCASRTRSENKICSKHPKSLVKGKVSLAQTTEHLAESMANILKAPADPFNPEEQAARERIKSLLREALVLDTGSSSSSVVDWVID